MVDRASLGWQEEAEQITFWQGNHLKICVVITVGVLGTVSCSVMLIIKHCRNSPRKMGIWGPDNENPQPCPSNCNKYLQGRYPWTKTAQTQ